MPGYRFNKAATVHMLDVTNWADKNRWEYGTVMSIVYDVLYCTVL